MSYVPAPPANVQQKCIGILTSGGDAQGMNAAVRAVVRKTISMGHKCYAIMNGYQGMVENDIRQMGWEAVGGIMSEGGTFIGTARCLAFMKREGRKVAVKNLMERSIDRLVIIGGDGSLTGAHFLSKEWPELMNEIIHEKQEERKKTITDPAILKEKEREDEEFVKKHSHLTIVGLVGSIDNDMCGTEMTIGAATALTRVMDAVDCISSTAASHQRDFIVEVMGRNCGWLALMGALATGADYLLIPEHPQPVDWREKLWDAIKKGKEMGKRASIVIVAEGAKDENGKPLKSADVKDALDTKGCEARVTILGHVQRGGHPVAYDRNMSTMVGCKAAEEALCSERKEACFVGIKENRVAVSPLTKCLEETRSIEKAISARDYQKALSLRSRMFAVAYDVFTSLSRVEFSAVFPDAHKKLRIGVMHVGACAPGMNAAVRASVRLGLLHGHTMVGIRNGFEGLLSGDTYEMNWMSVNGWARQGGAYLGVRRVDPNKLDYKAVVQAIEKQKLEALIMIGGWDGYHAFSQLNKKRDQLPALNKIPILLIPASISNNLPYTESSIGDDTALNNTLEALDKIKESAVSTNRVFVVEVMGSNGYLTLMSAMASGAELAYMPEDPPTLLSLQRDINALRYAFKNNQRRGLVINNEEASKVFTTQTLADLFEDQSQGLFSSRAAILGHLQQGGAPSALDRTLATTLAYHGIKFIEEQSTLATTSAFTIGMIRGRESFTPLEQAEQEMDFKARRPKTQWWTSIRDIQQVYGLIYPNDDTTQK